MDFATIPFDDAVCPMHCIVRWETTLSVMMTVMERRLDGCRDPRRGTSPSLLASPADLKTSVVSALRFPFPTSFLSRTLEVNVHGFVVRVRGFHRTLSALVLLSYSCLFHHKLRDNCFTMPCCPAPANAICTATGLCRRSFLVSID